MSDMYSLFPSFKIDVIDDSIRTASVIDTGPLTRTVHAIRARKGREGLFWGNGAACLSEYGDETFDESNKSYFFRENAALKLNLTKNSCWVVRITDPSAKKAAAILEGVMTPRKIKQYQRTATGGLVYDSDGERVLDFTITGTQATVVASTKGYVISDTPTALANGEYTQLKVEGVEIDGVYSRTANDGDKDITFYMVKKDARQMSPVIPDYGYVWLLTTNYKAPVYAAVDGNVIDIGRSTSTGTPAQASWKGASTQTVKVRDGYTISYRTRTKLTLDEKTAVGTEVLADADSTSLLVALKPYKIGSSDTNDLQYVYPIAFLRAANRGLYGEDLAMSFYYDPELNSAAEIEGYGACMYTFAPQERKYGSTSVVPIRNLFNVPTNNFVMKEDVWHPVNQILVSAKDILSQAFPTDSKPLPYEMIWIPESFAQMGNRVLENEPKILTTVMDDADYELPDDFAVATSDLGFMVNIISGIDANANPYHTVEVKSGSGFDLTGNYKSVTLSSSTNLYLMDGSDGKMTDWAFETNFRNWLELSTDPTIRNRFRYPMSHMFDYGFSIDTKKAMIKFLAIRDDVAIDLSTQVLYANKEGFPIRLNDQATDESVGAALKAMALMVRESDQYGTDNCRCGIYTQAGVANIIYTGYMPCSLWGMYTHAEYGNKTYLYAEPIGNPRSFNTLFKSLNWWPIWDDDFKRLFNNGLNYCCPANETQFFYPVVGTVYPYASSVLKDKWNVNVILWTKKICAEVWRDWCNSKEYNDTLLPGIKRDMENRVNQMVRNRYRFSITPVITARDAEVGKSLTVRVNYEFPDSKIFFTFEIYAGVETVTVEA